MKRDPRAERTRQQIFAAVRRLTTDGAASVGIADIVNTAGISRSSFYAHFTGIDDVASELLRLQVAEIESAQLETNPAESWMAGNASPLSGRAAARIRCTQLVTRLVETFPLYSSVLELPLARNGFDDIVTAFATKLLESFREFDELPNEVDAQLAATYIAGGTMTVISAWLRGTTDFSDDELVDQLVGLLPAWLTDPRH